MDASGLLYAFVLCAVGTGASGAKDSACGKPVNRNGRIIGGSDATNGEFPFMVSLRGPEEPGASQVLHKCGAVLLDRRWVLTAAHCVFEYRRKKYLRRLKARLGGHDASTATAAGQGEQEIGVESLLTHPSYQDPFKQSNDIALLKLQRDANLGNKVYPACLPNPTSRLEGTNATVAGWGRMTISSDGSGDLAKILQRVNVPVLSNNVCKKMIKEAGHYFPLEENQMCAGYREGGKDSCKKWILGHCGSPDNERVDELAKAGSRKGQADNEVNFQFSSSGDSGGPLFIKQNGRFTVIGLVSAGIECGSPLLPGIYTRIISHLRWISDKMAE